MRGTPVFVHYPRRLPRSEGVPPSWSSWGRNARTPVMGHNLAAVCCITGVQRSQGVRASPRAAPQRSSRCVRARRPCTHVVRERALLQRARNIPEWPWGAMARMHPNRSRFDMSALVRSYRAGATVSPTLRIAVLSVEQAVVRLAYSQKPLWGSGNLVVKGCGWRRCHYSGSHKGWTIGRGWTLLGMARPARWPKYSSSHKGWTIGRGWTLLGKALPTRWPK